MKEYSVNKKAELLMPAGNAEKLRTVLHYGADAVYLGGELFSLRALSDNFTDEELKDAVEYAHSMGKKVYVALNIIAHNDELKLLSEYVKYIESIGVDGVIVADLGVFSVVRENSSLNISVSTQASNTNWQSVKMWKQLGAKRVVLAREVSLEEIREIKEKVPDIEIEVFVHGAMCISISGRCLLSNYMTGRDANRGNCAQSCRWTYHLMEEKRDGEFYPVYEDEQGTYIFNSKDLCTIEFIDKILDIGVDSLKIEGRMKGIYYAAVLAKVYREALDKYYSGSYSYDSMWMRELESISHRNYTSGFYLGKTDTDSQNYEFTSYKQTHILVAKVLERIDNNTYKLEIRNRVIAGEEIEIVKPNSNFIKITMPEMIDEKNGNTISTAHPNTIVTVKIDADFGPMDLFRREDKKTGA